MISGVVILTRAMLAAPACGVPVPVIVSVEMFWMGPVPGGVGVIYKLIDAVGCVADEFGKFNLGGLSSVGVIVNADPICVE